MSQAVIATDAPWYRLLNRSQWNTLVAANLGWMFDGYETFALVTCVGAALRELLEPGQFGQIPFYAGAVLALTLLGWAIGGLIGGVLADYLGRKRTMLLAILAYSLLTALSAFAWDWLSFAALRFVVGIGIGSEWATGTAIVSELWPARARGRGLALMSCGLGIGFFLASFVWLFVGPLGPQAWRLMFVIGVLPALLTLWVMRAIPESGLWETMDRERRRARAHKRAGSSLTPNETALARFTVADLFAEPEPRRHAIVGLLMSLATNVGFWGITAWVPLYIGGVAEAAGLPASGQWQSYAGMAYNGGAVAGYVAFGFAADAVGRKAVTIVYIVASLLSLMALFLWAEGLTAMMWLAGLAGVFVTGQFTWMAVWLPELFPTRVRATATAFVFNAPRFVAALGPLASGFIIANLGGYSHAALTLSLIYVLALAAAPFLPETLGKPLPA